MVVLPFAKFLEFMFVEGYNEPSEMDAQYQL